ncbi:chemotaxis protein CheW [Phormidesmis sp. 146-35]
MMQSSDSALALSSLSALIVGPLPPETRQRLLRFQLGTEDSVLLPLGQITEILKIDGSEILPVPDMPGCVMGICNWRGEMLWLIDFNDFAGYPSPFQPEQRATSIAVIVAQINHQSIGLGVQQVHDIELQDLRHLQPTTLGLFAPQLLPLVQGTIPGCRDAVLDLQPIVHCPLWKKYPGGEA